MRKTIDRYQGDFNFQTIESGYLPFGSFPERKPELTARNLVSMGLNPENKTLVYMPWGKPYSSWDFMAKNLVLETPRHFNLILRPHPSQGISSRRSDRAGFRLLAKLCEERGDTLLDLNTYPLSQLFSLADLMITDGTSPAEESLFYDVPQLFIQTPLWNKDVIHAYARRENMHADDLARYLDLFECGTTYQTSQPEPPIAQSITDALESSESRRPKREQYFNWVFGQRDRMAGERVSRAIHSLIR